MKKIICVVCITIAILVAFNALVGAASTDFSADNAGKRTSISWEYVNVRHGHSENSKVLTTCVCGDTLILTGKTFQSDYYNWTQIRLPDGRTGWVVTDSINM